MNLEPCMEQLREKCPDALVVAVDASVGSADHVGYVTLGRGPLKPGLGVSKDLDAVGDLFITGIVGSVRNGAVSYTHLYEERMAVDRQRQ